MDIERAYKALEEVAAKKGITVEQVISDIDFAIAVAIVTAMQKNDIAVLKEWQSIPCVGSVPTAVELMAYLGEKTARQTYDEGGVRDDDQRFDPDGILS